MKQPVKQRLNFSSALFSLCIATSVLLPVSGCKPKTSDAEGKKAMESFKGGGETKDERAGDAKDMQAAQDYRKAHPEQFPEPKYTVPQGPKAPSGTGPVGGNL